MATLRGWARYRCRERLAALTLILSEKVGDRIASDQATLANVEKWSACKMPEKE